MLIGYARVSTSGQDTAQQRADLTSAGCTRIFSETVSGAKKDRPELLKMIEHLRSGDIIVVTRLDRLARSTIDLLHLGEQIAAAGAGLKSLAEPWADSTTPAGKMVLTVFAALADFERSLILDRTSSGRAAAKARGVKFGPPPALKPEQVTLARELRETKTAVEVARLLGVHRSTIYRALKD